MLGLEPLVPGNCQGTFAHSEDLARIIALVDALTVVEIAGGHEIHRGQPQRYIGELTSFVDGLKVSRRLPAR